MQELDLQKFLRSFQQLSYHDINRPLNELKDKFAISSKRHTKYPNLILFKYNQIESDFSLKIVRESRGIILDENDNYKVICHTFDKFFNYGEGHATEISWDNCVVQEKCDGSIMQLFFYNGEWLVASSGSPDAGGQVNEEKITFSELFWRTFNDLGCKLPTNTNFCYAFELMTPINRVVVIHESPKLVLLGARDLLTDEEYPVGMIAEDYMNVPRVKTFPLKDLESIFATTKDMQGLHQEGYVVVDRNFNRVKIKCDNYQMLHHAKDGFSTRTFVDIARNGEVSEIIANFPEFKNKLDVIKDKYEAFVSKVSTEYELIKHIETQKEFALKAVKTTCSSALFAVRAKKYESFQDFFAKYNIDSLIEQLGV